MVKTKVREREREEGVYVWNTKQVQSVVLFGIPCVCVSSTLLCRLVYRLVKST